MESANARDQAVLGIFRTIRSPKDLQTHEILKVAHAWRASARGILDAVFATLPQQIVFKIENREAFENDFLKSLNKATENSPATSTEQLIAA